METDKVTLILSIWGAGLATILGAIDIIKFRKEYRIKLLILPAVDTPFNQIQISVVNDGSKPATITNYSISFGTSFNLSTELVSKQIDAEKRLSESDRWTTTIEREEIINAIQKHNLTQKPFHRLWASVQLSNGKRFWDSVYINPKIIEKQYFEKAEQFIATDLFLGFKQMDSEFYPIGAK